LIIILNFQITSNRKAAYLWWLLSLAELLEATGSGNGSSWWFFSLFLSVFFRL
jgi:hypothetical protein